MSYMVKHARSARRRVKPRPALSGWFDDLVADITGVPTVQTVSAATGIPAPPDNNSFLADVAAGITGVPAVGFDAVWQRAGGQPTDVCISQANAQTATFDANTSNIATNWQPSGFYSPDQLHQIVTQMMTVVQQAGADLQSAQGSWTGDPGDLTNALDDINRVLTGTGIKGTVSTNGQQYLALEQQARSGGANVISAPDLKQWVVNGLQAISNAYTTIYVLACQQPTWITIIAKAAQAVAAVVNFILGVVGVLAKIGDAILNAPSAAAGALKWVLLAGVGLWAFSKYKAKAH